MAHEDCYIDTHEGDVWVGKYEHFPKCLSHCWGLPLDRVVVKWTRLDLCLYQCYYRQETEYPVEWHFQIELTESGYDFIQKGEMVDDPVTQSIVDGENRLGRYRFETAFFAHYRTEDYQRRPYDWTDMD